MSTRMKRVLFVLLAVMLVCSACSKKTEKETGADPAVLEQLKLGDQYLGEKKYEEAIAAYEKCLEMDAAYPDAYMRLSDVYMKQELPDSAVEILERGFENTQNDNLKKLYGERCKELAEQYYADEEYDSAIPLYEKLLSLDRSNVDVYLTIHEMYMAMEEYDSADSILEQGYEATKNESILKTRYEGMFSMAENCLENESYDEAIPWLEKILELGKGNDATLVSLGKAYAAIDEYDEAMAALEKVENQDDEQAKRVRAYILSKRGEQYYNEGNQNEAVKDLTQAVELDPDNMEAYTILISLYAENGKTAEAEKWISQGMNRFMNAESASDEYFDTFLYTISDYYSAKDDTDACLNFWEKAASLQPDNDGFRNQMEGYRSSMADEAYSKAEELLSEGDVNGAAPYFRKALSLAPNNYKPGILYADNGVYYLEKNGSFKTGWYTAENGDRYYFSTEQGPSYASAVTEWNTIDGNEYYFIDDGRLLVNDETPDGFMVGPDGKKIGGSGETGGAPEETDEEEAEEEEEEENEEEQEEKPAYGYGRPGEPTKPAQSGKLFLNVEILKAARENNGVYALRKEQLFDGSDGESITMNDIYTCMSQYGMKVQWLHEEATYALAMGDMVIWVFPGASLSDGAVIVKDTEKYKESLRQKPLPDGTTYAVKFDPKASGTNESVDLDKIEAVNNR